MSRVSPPHVSACWLQRSFVGLCGSLLMAVSSLAAQEPGSRLATPWPVGGWRGRELRAGISSVIGLRSHIWDQGWFESLQWHCEVVWRFRCELDLDEETGNPWIELHRYYFFYIWLYFKFRTKVQPSSTPASEKLFSQSPVTIWLWL